MEENGKIRKVILVFDHKTYTATGQDAEDWLRRVDSLEMLGMTHDSLMQGCSFKWTKITDRSKHKENTTTES